MANLKTLKALLDSKPEDILRDDCKKCGGTGYYFVQNGEDDVDKEICEYCNNFEINKHYQYEI
jgi:hypothetical protein